jgi:predicted nuclease of restriction endonuclease-like (RecB) superfamily
MNELTKGTGSTGRICADSTTEIQTKFIIEIKQKIRQSQYEAMKAVNVQLINLYWEIGKSIAEKQSESWGKSIVPALSRELQAEFPGITGFSTPNLWFMAKFYTEYQAVENLYPLVREISWAKNVLIHQIENKSYEKYLLNQTNFADTLPEKIKNQAVLAVKDEYNFSLLGLANEHSENELETALVNNIRRFLLEMGGFFAFVGNRFRIEVADKEYFIDLLLYHRRLQCLVAVELKIGEFLPEYKGKMEFYLSVLNDKVKLPNENDAIGIIICKEKNRTIVEYSLKTSTLPIGVATYPTSAVLPESYQKLLPDSEEISEKLKILEGI